MRERLEALMQSTPATTGQRIRELEAMLTGMGPSGRDDIADWVGILLPVEGLVPDIYQQWRPLVRAAVRFMVSHLSPERLAPKLLQQIDLSPSTPPEIRLMRLMERMPAVQKLGQVLARNRHLDPALRSALTQLENGICDTGFDQISAILTAELGERMHVYGVVIEPAIFSEASVSAVLRFTWCDPETGCRERGVFKVLKPHIPAYFAEDLTLFQQLAELLTVPELSETLREVCDLLVHEVNFVQEQATLERACNVYRAVPGVRAPRLVRPLCSARVTAMSEEHGVKVTEAFADMPASRARIAELVVEALIAAPLLDENDEVLFHADPHAGNLLYDETRGELVLLDWALSEKLTREQVRQLSLLVVMLVLRDASGAARAIAAIGAGDERLICEQVREFITELPYWSLPGSLDVTRLLDRLALDGIRFPAPLLMFRKVLFTLDGILHELAGSRVSLDAVVLRYLLANWKAGVGLLAPADWFALQCSAMFYGTRLWLSYS